MAQKSVRVQDRDSVRNNQPVHPIAFDRLTTADLVVDATYEGGGAGHIGDDALAKLLPVGNQGGFRYRGTPPTPRLVALVYTGQRPEWPDELDPHTGVFTYYGDNQTPGHLIHDTKRRGNQILAEAYSRAHRDAAARGGAPVFLLFQA